MEKVIDNLKKLDVPSISDAMDKLGIPAGCLGIKPVVRGHSFCGRAFTVHYVPCGVHKGTVGDFLDDVAPGEVIVIDNSGREYCTVWGDIMTNVAAHRGIEATVIDGVCRDINGIEKLNYPVYSKGYYMMTGKERVEVDAINQPVAISGLQIRPGDILRGDDSGVIVIPTEYAEQIVKSAQHIEATEQQIIQFVHEGHTLKTAREKMHYHTLQSHVNLGGD